MNDPEDKFDARVGELSELVGRVGAKLRVLAQLRSLVGESPPSDASIRDKIPTYPGGQTEGELMHRIISLRDALHDLSCMMSQVDEEPITHFIPVGERLVQDMRARIKAALDADNPNKRPRTERESR